MFGSQNNTSGFGAASNANTSGGGLFGNKPAAGSSGFSFGGSSMNNTNGTSSGGLFGNNSASSNPSGGLFGISNNSSSNNSSGGLFAKPSTTGGLFGNNNSTTTNNNQSSGLFGNNNTQSSTSTGGLFGNSNNTQSNTSSGGLFGNSNSTSSSGGLFGNSNTNSTSSATNGGLFGAKPSGGLFGNSQQSAAPSSGSFFGNSNGLNGSSNLAIGTPPTKQYNFKDLPKSLTDSAKTNKTIYHTSSTRKRSLSSSSPATMITSRSSILQRLSTTFSNIKSENDYNSEGLFSPRKHLIQSALSPEKQGNDKPRSNRVVSRSFASTSMNPRTLRNRGSTTSEFLKLKVDPSRTEARRLKIFGKSGGATKVRILGSEEEETTNVFADDRDEDAKPDTVPDDTVLENGVASKQEEHEQEEPTSATEVIKRATHESDYWCSPSINELSSLQLRQLSEISGFAIGRKGFGTIIFDLPVDLTAFASDLPGYLFGNVVKFNKNKTVEVYPHGSVPVGTGLNVPATITLENVFPITKSKNNPTDPDAKDLELRLFIKKLKALKDMEFVTYDPIHGAWTFKVKHFSIWGLVDEDAVVVDTDAELQNAKTPVQSNRASKESSPDVVDGQTETKIPRKFIKPRTNVEDTFVFKRQKQDKTYDHDTTTLQMPGSFIIDNTQGLILQDNEEDIELCEELNTDNVLSDEYYMKIEDVPEAKIPARLGFNGDEYLLDDGEDLAEKQFEPLNIDRQDFDILDADPELAVADSWEKQLEISARFDSAFANNDIKRTTAHDAPFSKYLTPGELDTLLFGDSVKVYDSKQKVKEKFRLEGHNLTLFTPDNQVLVKDFESTSNVSFRPLSSPFGFADRSLVKAICKNHLKRASIIRRRNNFPKTKPTPSLSFKSIIDTFDGHAEYSSRNVWQLASVLFDDEILESEEIKAISRPETVNRIIDIRRREGILSWIKSEIQNDIDAKFDTSKDTFEQIFLLLVTSNISSATKLAIKSNNAHLGVLISLLGSNDPEVKYSAQQQISYWKSNAVLQTIPDNLLKIYYLLTGNFLSQNTTVNVTEALSWKAKLSLLLSYGNINETVTSLLTSFIDGQAANIPSSDLAQFSLLKLFVHVHSSKYELGSIFSSLKTEACYDVSLKWYVYEVLVRSSNQLTFSKNIDTGDKLTSLFAEQLYSNGLFEEAIFIMSHLSNDQEVKARITQLISVNIEQFSNTPGFLDLLTSTLKVPEKVILEAKALHSRYVDDMWKEVSYLLDAENFEEAHKTIIERVAPAAVINNGSKIKLLEEFISRFPEQHGIKGWATGLAIYKNYILFLRSGSELSLRYLVENLPLVKLSNFKVRVAINLVSKKVTNKIIDSSKREGSAYFDLDLHKVLKLPVGEEEKPYIARRVVLHTTKHHLTQA